MKQTFYIARPYILTILLLLVFIAIFTYYGPEPAYLEWLDSDTMRGKHAYTYKLFMYLGPLFALITSYDIYRFLSRRHVRFDENGITDNYSFKGFGAIAWANISAVEIQSTRYGIGIIIIHLDRPLRARHTIKLGNIGISNKDVASLTTYFPKVEQATGLGYFS